MRSNMKNKSLCVLTAAAALCIGGAVAGLGLNAVSANADEETTNYYAFVDVGADSDATSIDTKLGLAKTENVTASDGGTVVEGSTLFGSYSTGKTYSFELDAGTYQVAVAVDAASNDTITVGGGTPVAISEAGKQVVPTTATVAEGTALTVTGTGKICAILVADEGSNILMSAEYTKGQVISYGKLLSEVLDPATGYYSNGTIGEAEIEYDVSATVGTGVNTLFTTSEVTGTVKGTSLSVSRYVITMPDDLVYFINCGSSLTDNEYKEGAGIDPYYDHNQTVFDYYKAKGSALKNDGKPDEKVAENGSGGAGHYSNSVWSVVDGTQERDFPYNTLIWNKKNVLNMGYILPGLDSGNYRVYIGSLSNWHGRNVNITFNDQVVGTGDLSIKSTKSFAVFENVPAKDGKINIKMVGGSTNEPCINFIAVQKMETVVNAAPSAPEAPSEIGMNDHALNITGGLVEGAKLQLYNAVKPNNVLFEEKVDLTKAEEGTYTLDWGEVFDGVSQFYLIQVTNGGASEPHRVSITDIEGFAVTMSPEGYTTGAVTVSLTAHANSGIKSWSYQLGEFGVVNEFTLDNPYEMHESFTVQENGEYIVKVYSGVGAISDKTVIIGNIDPDRPVITITPSRVGWESGAYNVTLAVGGIAPVAEYKLFKNGALVASAENAPATVKFTEEGEYLVYVKNEAGQSSTSMVCVSGKPTMTKVVRSFANRTLKYTFEDTKSYKIATVSAYALLPGGV
ncbi:MAG: hypothetical protein K2L02_03565, partial [Clostridia bacterium]|nr:hypothetical protein [Clostridia bacterium]